jgi:ABC-2 type transport system ATP-binding protein
VLEVANLVRNFNGTPVLRGVSFTVRSGEAVAYLGPNGAGKSTTIKTIAGLLRPTSGQVSVCGHDVESAPLEAKKRLGYVPDQPALFGTLTPAEYLSLLAELHHLDRNAARKRLENMVAAFDAADVMSRQIDTLSRGQQQKVLLMAALLHDPEVLLLDEPLNGLDVNTALTFRQVLERLVARGKTILFCSHILEVVERICSRVVLLDRGQVVADAPMRDLLRQTHAGTLEAVFRQLTRREQADEGSRAFLEAIEREGFRPQAV